MNKRGFTLIELVAVIVILGVLVVLVSPAIIGMRNNVIRNTLENKLSMISEAAIDFASDNIMDIPKGIESVMMTLVFQMMKEKLFIKVVLMKNAFNTVI
jgi:prepilin-type N-terminal cleavage/methylation domain-containing protein